MPRRTRRSEVQPPETHPWGYCPTRNLALPTVPKWTEVEKGVRCFLCGEPFGEDRDPRLSAGFRRVPPDREPADYVVQAVTAPTGTVAWVLWENMDESWEWHRYRVMFFQRERRYSEDSEQFDWVSVCLSLTSYPTLFQESDLDGPIARELGKKGYQQFVVMHESNDPPTDWYPELNATVTEVY